MASLGLVKVTRGTSTTAVAVAPVPPPPIRVILGSERYPVPGLVTEIVLTAVPESVAMAVAPKPPPPEIWTVGALV